MAVPSLRPVPGPADVASALARLAPMVLGWCRRLGGPTLDAHEAAQEVLMVTARRIDELDRLDTLEPWVFAVTRNVVRRHRRRTWAWRWAGAVDEREPARGPDPEGVLAERRTAALLDRALDVLPLEQREVLVLCLAEGRTDTEVAALTGVPAATVRSRLRLARARFRAVVEADPTLAPLRRLTVEGPHAG